jgi:ABC-2 type transport system ATP-binding protein
MVEISNLDFSYRKKMVFEGLNLQLTPGHIYGLLGRNGMGKSTLLRCIAGLLFPKSGQIHSLGFLPMLRQPEFLEQIFIIPEEFYLPDIQPAQMVRTLAPFYPKFDVDQFNRFSKDFEIPQKTTFGSMSYGQKKKTLISFGLATNALLLLMDEPTNGLDILSKSQFRKVMAGSLDDKKCILISTHQIKDLENMIDRILMIEEGKIIFNQAIENIYQKLCFRISTDIEEINQALYVESSLRGSSVISLNISGEATGLDLEMLYKAVVTFPGKMNMVFNR